MVSLFNLIARVSLDGSGYQIGLKRLESSSKQFARDIKGEFARAFGVAAVTAYTTKLVNMADQIIDVSDRLGMSTQVFQQWASAAKKSGSSIEGVTKFLEGLAVAREKALEGDEKTLGAFDRLGINESELETLSISDLGRSIANTVRNGNIQDLISSLREVAGRSAGEMVAALKALEELFSTAPLWSEETLQGLKDLKSEVLSLADAIAGPLAAALDAIANNSFIREMFNGIAAPFAATGAYIGARVGGATPSEAVDAAAKASEDQKLSWQRKQEASQKAIDDRKAMAAAKREERGALRRVEGVQNIAEKAQKAIERPQLNSWQQMGAAVRFTPENHGRDIARNTAKTAEKVEQVKAAIERMNNVNGLGADNPFGN